MARVHPVLSATMAALLLQVSDHGIPPSYGQSTRRPASRSQTAESHLRPRSTPGSFTTSAGKPIATRRPRALPCGVVARRQFVADSDRRSLGDPPALSAKASATAITDVRRIRQFDADSVQGSASYGSARGGWPYHQLVDRCRRDHSGHGRRDQRSESSGSAGTAGGAR